jgi:hypothetical protein
MMLDEMCYDSKARPIRERKMPENLTHLEMLARAQTGAAIKTLAEIATTSASPHIRKRANAALRDFLHRFPAAALRSLRHFVPRIIVDTRRSEGPTHTRATDYVMTCPPHEVSYSTTPLCHLTAVECNRI